MEAGLLSMEPACEGHPQIGGVSDGVRVVLNRPEVLDRPVLEGAGAVDGLGAAIYGSVIRDGGVFRMWYQAWPKQALKGGDSVLVACAESDDGLVWRRPSYGLMEWEGRRDNHLTDLPFHSPSVLIDPTAGPEARYRAFGCTGRRKLADLDQDFQLAATAHYAYYSAHSADGLHWIVDGPEPAWPWADVITSTWDPWAGNALIALKHNGRSAGMHRRRFRIANWSNGIPNEAVTALVPDEYDDQIARSRGFDSADYYGLGLYPGPTVTIGFLWNFRHQAPLSSNITLGHFGGIGSVDVSLVYQTERGGSWQHLPGRPDWMAACDMPDWASGAIYTAASPIEVGDETWLYFTGTSDRHGWAGSEVDTAAFRRERGMAAIGLARWPRGRLMGYESRLRGVVRLEPRQNEDGNARLVLNVDVRAGGRVRAELLNDKGETLLGYGFDDCEPLGESCLAKEIQWRGDGIGANTRPATALIELENSTLYGFSFV
ncbi:MAG: hypothetical protein ACI906_003502 [Candidatus Latescibacterota bacterium]|jgi:hypothetical protein